MLDFVSGKAGLRAMEVSELSVSYGQGKSHVLAVSDVSFDVMTGEAFGLVGESGSGKSTVLGVLAGLVKPARGEAVIAGKRLVKPDPARVQMVFQDPYGSLHPRHTVDDALSEPLVIRRTGDIDHRVRQAMDQVGLRPEHRFRFPHQLSGGQRQRVAIARAVIGDPSILLLDEPTSALDVSVQAEILNLFRRLRHELGLTMVMVSHNLAVIAYLCDRIAVMRHGRLLEEVGPEDLLRGTGLHPYTTQLLRASKGYDRALLAEIS